MTKAELIDEVSKISNLTKKETETIVDTIFDNITDALATGEQGRVARLRQLPDPAAKFPQGAQSQDGQPGGSPMRYARFS